MSEPRREKCIWCAGDDGVLTTVEVPVDTEIPAGEPRMEEVAVHPRHASEARDYLFAFARYAMRDMLIVIFGPVLMVATVPLARVLSGAGGSEHVWRLGLLSAMLLLHGAYVVRFPYSLTPRRLSMKIGGLGRGRRIVQLVGGTISVTGAALGVLALA